jgi:hypothetical protein
MGLLCLSAAFLLAVYDGTKSIADDHVYFTSGRMLWETIDAASLAGWRNLIESCAGGILWDPVTVSALAFPAWASVALLGVVLLLLGRRKKPLIGYVRP